MPRGLCIHGHFYQPPREDPVTGRIPREIGAHPFPNWNARIHHECYRPNARSGNFERISFNVGPTLFTWMEPYDPDTYARIVAADRLNRHRHDAGNAMAQAYNHTILPLASERDRRTQIAWGIADFRHRFGHAPEGMWLPETAVSEDTLREMARQGIRFTILAPWQAAEPVDPRYPYRVPLGSGREIIVFFYHQELSGRVSFDSSTTQNADAFALHDALAAYDPDTDEPQLLLIASDGELYGHHKPFRDRFLEHLLRHAAPEAGLTPTYPARWLRKYPVTRTVRIRDNTSWSCMHGVARWSEGCSCTPGDSHWKHGLYHAMRRLAHDLDRIYEHTMGRWVHDPWHVRDAYIRVRLGEERLISLLSREARGNLETSVLQHARQLLEAQVERQRMFTSCAWFFEDLDRIEPKNALGYAARAAWLTGQATGIHLLPQARKYFHPVVSPRTGLRADEVFLHQYDRLSGTVPAEPAA